MAELQQQFEDELRALEREVDSQTHFEFVLLVKNAMEYLLKTRGRKGRTVDKRHPQFGPILQRSQQAVKIMHILGFVDMDDQHMHLTDYDQNVNALTCFADICKRSLEREGIRSASTIDATRSIESDDPTIVVAHLAYFYFMRLMFLIVTTEWQQLMGHLAFHVKVAMDIIDKCLQKLVLAQPGSVGYDKWKTTKECTSGYLANGGDIGEQLRDKMVEAANAITFEMLVKYSEGHVDLMVYMHFKEVLILVTTKGGMLDTDGIQRYMTASCSLPREYLSDQYMDTVDKVRGKCLESLERPLTSSEITEINHTLLWQSSNFLGQLRLPSGGPQPHRLGRSDAEGRIEFGGITGQLHNLRQLLQSSGGRSTRHEERNRHAELELGHVLGHSMELPVHTLHLGTSSDESDGEEKKDEGEKEKPDWDKEDGDVSETDEDLYQSDDAVNHSGSNTMSMTRAERIEEFDQIARTAISVKQIELLQQTIRPMIKAISEERVCVLSECSEFEAALATARSQGTAEIVTIMEAEKHKRNLVLQQLRDEIRLLHRVSRAASRRHHYLNRPKLSDLQSSATLSVLRETLVDRKEEQSILVNMMLVLVTDFLPSDLLIRTCRKMGVNVQPTRQRRQDWVAAILRFT